MTSKRLGPAEWQDAIADAYGRQLVVAGPGTGKTEFLVRRVEHVVTNGLAHPSKVVVLSFSRRSAARLRERIEARIGSSSVPVEVTTFHSLASRIIESATGTAPIPLTTPEQVSLVRSTLIDEDPDDWPLPYRGILDSHIFSAEVADFLLRCSERLMSPADLAERAMKRADWRGLPGLYSSYLERLAASGRTDYGVLLANAVDILSETPDAPGSGFEFILVDEFQDTTPAQARMAELLGRSGNLTVAGDPYQSIFSFRGADVENIARFQAAAPTKRIVLGKSFRVPQPIMEAALQVVSSGELPGAAGHVEPADHPGRVETYVFDQETAEAEWIAREVEYLLTVEEIPPSRIAIVLRSKKELISELSRSLARRDIPHDPPHSRLVDHPAIRLIQDLVTVSSTGGGPGEQTAAEAAVADRAMRRILLGPLVEATIGREREMLRERRRGPKAWSEVLARHLPERVGLVELVSDSAWATQRPAADGFWHLWQTLDGVDTIATSPERSGWRRALTSFGQMVARQGERDPEVSLARLFEMVDEGDFEATPLLSHRDVAERVTLTTMHQVKGLEFDVVFIANAVEGVFPDLRRSRRMLRPELLSPERTTDPSAQHIFQLQEEMRLAYTAMTRARQRVVWTATDAGVDQGENRPSRFLLAVADQAPSGPPTGDEREPVTVREIETMLRRWLVDPSAGPAKRIAAAMVLGDGDTDLWDPLSFAGVPEPGPDKSIIGDTIRLSPSQADSYLRCPRRYVLERRLRLGDSSSVYAHFGELCHEILERAEGEIIGTGQLHANLERVLELVEEVWEEADFGGPTLNEAWKAKAVDMLNHLYEHWPGRGEPIAVEVKVESEIGGVTWIGRVDRVERGKEGLRVIDYKTSASAPKLDDAARSVQLGFYAHAIGAEGEQVSASEMWFPRAKAKSVTTRKLSMHLLPEVLETMELVTESILAEDWAPRVSDECKRCGFRKSCPAWPEGKGAFLS